jgi:uncharacterized protein YggE
MRMLAAAAAAALSVAAPMAAEAQTGRDVSVVQQSPLAIEGTLLSVNAEGKVTGRPDMATLNMGVTTDGATAAAALAANSQRMNALIAALRRTGVAERDIQTANINVNPQYVYREGEAPRVTGYQASNTVTAKVRNLDRVGAAIDAAVNAGGNTVNGVSFSYQDDEGPLNEARTDAMGEARRRAELYARAAGLRVHRIVSISESNAWTPPIPMPMMARMDMAQANAPPVQPGQIETTVNLGVVFELR